MRVYRRTALIVLWVCAVVALISFAYPMFVIRPFRAQGITELALALVVKRWGAPASIGAAVLAVGAAFWLWRGSGKGIRAGVATLSILTAVFGVLAQVNVYERMFHRIDAPDNLPANAAGVEGDDMVLAIEVAGQSRAYPIRMIAYHHIVNDWLAGTAVVTTY